MKKCIICEIINTPQHLEDTIIYENDFFVVKAAKGMVVPGHLLIIPKEHINGLAEPFKIWLAKWEIIEFISLLGKLQLNYYDSHNYGVAYTTLFIYIVNIFAREQIFTSAL